MIKFFGLVDCQLALLHILQINHLFKITRKLIMKELAYLYKYLLNIMIVYI